MSIKFTKNRTAFTLAEVLITLAIIGVVASLTIPTLVQNYQNKQYAAAAAKAYSRMNQVLKMMALDVGTPDSIRSYFTGSSAVTYERIAAYFNIIKNCGTAGDGCFVAYDNNYDGSANSTSHWTNGDRYKFLTADGMSIALATFGNGCATGLAPAEYPDAPTAQSCAYFYVDTNGLKGPNCQGRDVFRFIITSNKVPILYPTGGLYHTYYKTDYYNCGSSVKDGRHCTGRLMENGWEFDW